MDDLYEKRAYQIQVEKLINKLRAACLGQDISLTAILPECFKSSPPEEQVEQITDQILFTLSAVAKENHNSLEELPEARKWIRDVTLYLMTWCCEEDRTCRQLVRLLEQQKGVRMLIFSSFALESGCHELTNETPPLILKNLEVAWLCLLDPHRLLDEPKTMFREFSSSFASLQKNSQKAD